MEETIRLNTIQAALTERGVRDVKFVFDGAKDQLPSNVKSEAVFLLEQFLDGNYTQILNT